MEIPPARVFLKSTTNMSGAIGRVKVLHNALHLLAIWRLLLPLLLSHTTYICEDFLAALRSFFGQKHLQLWRLCLVWLMCQLYRQRCRTQWIMHSGKLQLSKLLSSCHVVVVVLTSTATVTTVFLLFFFWFLLLPLLLPNRKL